MAANIRDVAEAAGVSVTTVSHVLSGRGRVAEQTRQRVSQIADELAYRPNVHAQQLVTRRSRTLAIQVASFAGPHEDRTLIPHSDYFLDLLNGAAAAAAKSGCALILVPPQVDASGLTEFAVDGVIVVDPRGDEPLFSGEWQRDRPLVTTGRPMTGGPARCVVDNDHVAAATVMLDHLEGEGYERPALVLTRTSRSYVADILAAYRTWIASRDLEPLVVEIGETPSETVAAQALGSLLELALPPDAVMASSEELALGVLHEARRRGIDVPQELGVCSAVDSSALRLTTPQVTGTMLHPTEIGRQAAEALLALAADPDGVPHLLTVSTGLCVRQSTRRTCRHMDQSPAQTE